MSCEDYCPEIHNMSEEEFEEFNINPSMNGFCNCEKIKEINPETLRQLRIKEEIKYKEYHNENKGV